MVTHHCWSLSCGKVPPSARWFQGLERQKLDKQRGQAEGSSQSWGGVGCPRAGSQGSGQTHKPLLWDHGERTASPRQTTATKLCGCKEVTGNEVVRVQAETVGHTLTVTLLFFLTDTPHLSWFPCLKTSHSPTPPVGSHMTQCQPDVENITFPTLVLGHNSGPL